MCRSRKTPTKEIQKDLRPTSPHTSSSSAVCRVVGNPPGKCFPISVFVLVDASSHTAAAPHCRSSGACRQNPGVRWLSAVSLLPWVSLPRASRPVVCWKAGMSVTALLLGRLGRMLHPLRRAHHTDRTSAARQRALWQGGLQPRRAPGVGCLGQCQPSSGCPRYTMETSVLP